LIDFGRYGSSPQGGSNKASSSAQRVNMAAQQASRLRPARDHGNAHRAQQRTVIRRFVNP